MASLTYNNMIRDDLVPSTGPGMNPAQNFTPTDAQTLTGGVATAATPTAPLPNPVTSLDGSQFVASTTPAPAAPGTSPVDVVSGIAGQIGTGLPAQSAGQTITDLNNMFGYNPSQTGVGMVQGINQAFAGQQRPDATAQTLGSLDQILGSGSSYIQNAQRRGLEQANSRGLLNSSIAGGAAQRAAIESSMPILGESMGLQRQRESQDFQANQLSRQQAFGIEQEREQQAFQKARDAFSQAAQLTGQDRQNAFNNAQNLLNQANDLVRQRESQAFQAQESQLDRTQAVNNQLLASQLRQGERVDEAQVQNWLNSESFTRQFNGQLAMLPMSSALDLTRAITQFAMQDPELYTPTVVSGMTEFFNSNMNAILRQYFPTTGGTP